VTVLSALELQQVANPTMTIPGLTADHKPPRPFQITDAAFCLMHPRSIIAEPPGAGKKLIAIMAGLKGMSLMKINRVLVISLGADTDQWVEELEEFTDGNVIQLYRGSPRDRRRMAGEEADWRITTYQTAAADIRTLIGMHDAIILDECSFIKTPNTHTQLHIEALCAPGLQEQVGFFTAMHNVAERKKWEKNRTYRPLPFPGHQPATSRSTSGG
jgi:hypothetical protein